MVEASRGYFAIYPTGKPPAGLPSTCQKNISCHDRSYTHRGGETAKPPHVKLITLYAVRADNNKQDSIAVGSLIRTLTRSTCSAALKVVKKVGVPVGETVKARAPAKSREDAPHMTRERITKPAHHRNKKPARLVSEERR